MIELAQALRAQAATLAAMADAIERESSAARPKWYTRENPPPGLTWRAARETCAREPGIVTAKIGRGLCIDVASWDAWVASRSNARRGPVELTSADEQALRALGVVVPARGSR